MQGFLAKFIEEFYRLFDTRNRGELHACYHDSCMLSLCVSTNDSALVTTRQYKYGALIYESRNLKRIDENKRHTLLRHGKTAALEFLRNRFPSTKHDGNSFRVDVLSTAVSDRQFDLVSSYPRFRFVQNNRAIFSVNGLYRESQLKLKLITVRSNPSFILFSRSRT